MLREELVGVGGEIEKLGLADGSVEHVVLDQFPVALFHAAHAGTGATAVNTIEGVANGLFLAHEDGFKAASLDGSRGGHTCQITEGGQHVEEVDIARCTRSRLDAWAFDDHGHTPGVLVEVLFSLQAVATNGNAVIGSVEDVGVVEFTHGFEF